MQHPGFFERAGPFPLQVIAAKLGAELGQLPDMTAEIEDVKPLGNAGPQHLAFFDNPKYLDQLVNTRAGGCLVAPAFAERVPASTAVLKTKTPYSAFAFALRLFYADALRPIAAKSGDERGGGTLIHPSARIDEGVIVEPGAVIGREAQIARGTTIAAGAVVGYRVSIGRDCYIGPAATVTHAIIGERVILHAGVRIGQDGFGFAMSSSGHLKVPQVGRVLIGNDVEIGANSTVDRGALNDTIIGEGTKIDNLVQIGHNAVSGAIASSSHRRASPARRSLATSS